MGSVLSFCESPGVAAARVWTSGEHVPFDPTDEGCRLMIDLEMIVPAVDRPNVYIVVPGITDLQLTTIGLSPKQVQMRKNDVMGVMNIKVGFRDVDIETMRARLQAK
jgi:hypothetical protein